MPEDGPTPDQQTRRCVALSDTTAWQMVDGRVVMLDLDSEHYYRLDGVGSRMWELLCDRGDVEVVHARLLDEYEVDPSVLRRDLDEFVAQLATAGLLRVEPTTSGGSASSPTRE
jgi:hypothetical protein